MIANRRRGAFHFKLHSQKLYFKRQRTATAKMKRRQPRTTKRTKKRKEKKRKEEKRKSIGRFGVRVLSVAVLVGVGITK
jgi:ribosomal protein L24E